MGIPPEIASNLIDADIRNSSASGAMHRS